MEIIKKNQLFESVLFDYLVAPTGWSAQTHFQSLEVGQDVRIEIVLPCLRKRVASDAFQFLQRDIVVPDQKNDVIQVGIQAAIQFAERNAVRIGHIDFQVPKLTDTQAAFRAPSRQRNKTFQWHQFDMDFEFAGDLQDGLVQWFRLEIVADKVNINRQARTAQQRQRTAAHQYQARSQWNTRAQGL